MRIRVTAPSQPHGAGYARSIDLLDDGWVGQRCGVAMKLAVFSDVAEDRRMIAERVVAGSSG